MEFEAKEHIKQTHPLEWVAGVVTLMFVALDFYLFFWSQLYKLSIEIFAILVVVINLSLIAIIILLFSLAKTKKKIKTMDEELENLEVILFKKNVLSSEDLEHITK